MGSAVCGNSSRTRPVAQRRLETKFQSPVFEKAASNASTTSTSNASEDGEEQNIDQFVVYQKNEQN